MRRTIVTLTLLCLVTLLFVPPHWPRQSCDRCVYPGKNPWMDRGINYWAKVTQERLKETYPNLEIIRLPPALKLNRPH